MLLITPDVRNKKLTNNEAHVAKLLTFYKILETVLRQQRNLTQLRIVNGLLESLKFIPPRITFKNYFNILLSLMKKSQDDRDIRSIGVISKIFKMSVAILNITKLETQLEKTRDEGKKESIQKEIDKLNDEIDKLEIKRA